MCAKCCSFSILWLTAPTHSPYSGSDSLSLHRTMNMACSFLCCCIGSNFLFFWWTLISDSSLSTFIVIWFADFNYSFYLDFYWRGTLVLLCWCLFVVLACLTLGPCAGFGFESVLRSEFGFKVSAAGQLIWSWIYIGDGLEVDAWYNKKSFPNGMMGTSFK